jgi:hypothetical protein
MFLVESMPKQVLDLLSMVGEVKTGKKHRNRVLEQCELITNKLNARLCLSSSPTQTNKNQTSSGQVPEQKNLLELGKEQVENVDGEKSLEREVREQSQSSLVLNQFVGARHGRTRMFVGTRVALRSPIILTLMAMIMSIGGVDVSTMNRRREMMGSSIKNSNVEVTISQNPDEALRNYLLDAQSSHIRDS